VISKRLRQIIWGGVLVSALVPFANGAGIPIINVTQIKSMVQEEIQKKINRARQELLAKTGMGAVIQAEDDRKITDDKISANVSSRLSDAIGNVSNLKQDASSRPFMDACSGVSAARAMKSSMNSDTYQKELPKKLQELSHPQNSPEIAELILKYNEEGVEGSGTRADKIAYAARQWHQKRLELLDGAIIAQSNSSEGFRTVYSPVIENEDEAQRIFFIRQMVLGSGYRKPGRNLVPNLNSQEGYDRDVVERAIVQASNSVVDAGPMFMNSQTTVVAAQFVPVEGAISDLAAAENQESFIVSATNDAQGMTDHSMLQREVILKAAWLAALNQKYKRGQLEIFQMSKLVLSAL